MQRPFAFQRREEERQSEKLRRRAETAEADARAPDANFKAKPFPSHLFGGRAHAEAWEREEAKRWRRAARADELLRTSSLPKNMTKSRPSHACHMTGEDGDWAASKSGITLSQYYTYVWSIYGRPM